MRNRLKKSSRPASISSTKSNSSTPQKSAATDAPHTRTPSAPDDLGRPPPFRVAPALVSSKAVGSIGSPDDQPPPHPHSNPTTLLVSANANLSRKLSTIRAVTSFDERPRTSSLEDEVFSSDGSLSATHHSNSILSSSVTSTLSASSSTSPVPFANTRLSPKSPSLRFKVSPLTQSATSPSLTVDPAIPIIRTGSPVVMPQRSSVEIPLRDSSIMAVADNSNTNTWDSTVGKAGLGKTGRVINRLVSDNEALKRDLNIERLKADESRQAARLLEDKMERLVSDYENRLLEASVAKTLLARKERQVESLQSAIELEKQRTADAKERERNWRDEMSKVQKEAKRQVEEATTHAALMEGRYNAISSHWRDQGDKVKQAMGRMKKDITELVEARRQDDDKIVTLRDLCDQQDSNIRVLRQQKEAIDHQFVAYKQTQEDALHDIKTKAAARETEQERTLEEARLVLEKLQWALSVKKNVDWAE